MTQSNSNIALVTGASKGIGHALVEELIANGWKVVGVARSKDALDEVAKSYGEGLFFPCSCDVSDRESVRVASKPLLLPLQEARMPHQKRL